LIFLIVCFAYGEPMLKAFVEGVQDSVVSGNAINANWLLTAYIEMQTHALSLGNGLVHSLGYWEDPIVRAPPYAQLIKVSSALRYICFVVAIAYFALSDRTFPNLVRAAVACFLAYVIFGNGVHENHEIVPAVLALCWLAVDRTRALEAVALGLLCTMNLFLFYGVSGDGLRWFRVIGWDITIYWSILNVVVFLFIWSPLATDVVVKLSQLRPVSAHANKQ
jgi:hypothetical protein